MTMTEYENKLLGLLKYVGFIKDEKMKIQRFLSGLPSFYKENIQYDEPRTLKETIRKAKYLYEQGKGKESMQKCWKDKKKDKYNQRRKIFKPPFNRSSTNTNQQEKYTKNESNKEESLGKSKLENSSLVQLDTSTKRRINEMVRGCPINLNGVSINVDMNIIP
jgi:hypothetical protein